MTDWSYFCFKSLKKGSESLSALQQPVYIEEAFSENPDVEAVGEGHLVSQSDKNLPEQGRSFRDVGIFAQFALLDPPPNNVVPEPGLLFHPFVEFALAVGIVEKYLLIEVEIAGIGQLSGHLFALDIAQSHDLRHGVLHALNVFVDEVSQ